MDLGIAAAKESSYRWRKKVNVVDNYGAKKVMCIQALKGKKSARLGDIIVASVRTSTWAVIAWATMQQGRCDGSEVKFDDNAVMILNKQGEPIETRVFGPVPHKPRHKSIARYGLDDKTIFEFGVRIMTVKKYNGVEELQGMGLMIKPILNLELEVWLFYKRKCNGFEVIARYKTFPTSVVLIADKGFIDQMSSLKSHLLG